MPRTRHERVEDTQQPRAAIAAWRRKAPGAASVYDSPISWPRSTTPLHLRPQGTPAPHGTGRRPLRRARAPHAHAPRARRAQSACQAARPARLRCAGSAECVCGTRTHAACVSLRAPYNVPPRAPVSTARRAHAPLRKFVTRSAQRHALGARSARSHNSTCAHRSWRRKRHERACAYTVRVLHLVVVRGRREPQVHYMPHLVAA